MGNEWGSMITSQHLRMARAGLGWTLRDLADRADVNPNTISRYEAGRDVLSGTLRKVEDTLKAAGVVFVDDEAGPGVRVPHDTPKR
jgi:transcriptional regulator with XRE-family HTH domain